MPVFTNIGLTPMRARCPRGTFNLGASEWQVLIRLTLSTGCIDWRFFMSGRDDLRRARRLWIEHGGTVEDVRRTGEERYVHPAESKPITVNKRRKDTPRKLLSALRRIMML